MEKIRPTSLEFRKKLEIGLKLLASFWNKKLGEINLSITLKSINKREPVPTSRRVSTQLAAPRRGWQWKKQSGGTHKYRLRGARERKIGAHGARRQSKQKKRKKKHNKERQRKKALEKLIVRKRKNVDHWRIRSRGAPR